MANDWGDGMRNYVQRIPLGNGKWAFEQEPDLIDSAENWMRLIRGRWTPPNYFFHLRSGGHVAAVQSHLESNSFAKIDLRRFFEQVTKNRVIKRLSRLGFPPEDAIDFAVASTIRKEKNGRDVFVLPYGFVQSAMLASLDTDCSALGRQLAQTVESGLTVSVYVDDIVISGKNEAVVQAALDDTRNAAAQSHFEVNDEKSTGVQAVMTAFNIEFGHGFMRITTPRMHEFQQAIMTSYDDDAKIAVLAYIKSVNLDQAVELYAALHRHLECARHILEA